MFLRNLTKNHLMTINYYQSGFLQICKGRVYNFDLNQKPLTLIDE